MTPFPQDPDYANSVEADFQHEADLADDAEAAGVTPEELLAQREERKADAVRDSQRGADDKMEDKS